MRRLAFIAACSCVATLVAAGGCRPEGGLHVVVDGVLSPGEDFDVLVVEVRREGEAEVLAEQRLTAAEIPSLPAKFNFLSGPEVPAGTPLRVSASAWRGDRVVSQVEQGAVLMTDEGGRLWLLLPPAESMSGLDGGP